MGFAKSRCPAPPPPGSMQKRPPWRLLPWPSLVMSWPRKPGSWLSPPR